MNDREFIMYTSTQRIAKEVYFGRAAAHRKHGENSIESIAADDPRWLPILGEEFGEVCETLTYDKDSSRLREELMDLVTVGTAWIAQLDSEAGIVDGR
jgi:NTP pyrophosphatase (non-canonical NTP hydrolase)